MKNCKRALIAFLPIVIAFLVTSCNLKESNNNFKGGELIDENLLSEIRSELEISETLTEENSTIDTDEGVTSSESGTNESLETITETDVKSDSVSDENTVYWSESGSVWHLYENCGHLKNSKNIISGTEEEAKEQGKERLCSSCEKKNDK